MKWNHLPEDGGLYDQNPQIIERFYYIFAEKSKQEAKERNKQGESGPGKRGSSRSPVGRRPR